MTRPKINNKQPRAVLQHFGRKLVPSCQARGAWHVVRCTCTGEGTDRWSSALTQREQGFGAAELRSGARDVHHLADSHVASLARPRRLGERAVAARVTAQPRQRQKHLQEYV